ncbi:PDZ domain-containing protein 8 [Tribolium madens]|uniref:PDZ domain-containing protein 8 n=1 Tax=Tribolium madens TaxID=41895 RepID=UPI001CF750C1|nr:PDZ domain-containing protein 8 [Tribolium madens]
MDIFLFMFLVFISFLIGVIVTLVVQYYILYSYFKTSPVVTPNGKKCSTDYVLPESLKKQLESEELNDATSLSVSLVLQFLFHELRHSEAIKRWLYKKLSLEFEELLTKTTIGKFFEVINIRDMNLGNHFPNIKKISIEDVKLDNKEGHIDTVSLCLDVDYTGNFLLSVDAKMKFGKTAYLSIKVNKVNGLVRLQFTRHPYTHWSFSFFQDPIIELEVESHFQGRQLQSNITSLIVNQIKKAIRRKHTLPNYKIRYKPFFIKTDPSQLDIEDSEIVPQGQLEVTCIDVTRLELSSAVQNVYCTVAVDTIPWICVYESEDRTFMILEITMTKLKQAQLGVIFKPERSSVAVESVSPHSCAFKSGLKPGDIVLAVENKSVSSVPQVAKFIKSVTSTHVTLRVKRLVDSYILRKKHFEKGSTDEMDQDESSFIIVDNVETPKKPAEKIPKSLSSNENVSKFAQTIGNFTLRKRKTSVSEKSSTEVSCKSTPTSSGPGTPQHGLFKQHTTPLLVGKKQSISEIPEILRENSELEVVEVGKSKELNPTSVLYFNDDFQFSLRKGLKYLNVNVWGTVNEDKDVLLGYANIPLSHILNECFNSVLGHYMRRYSFLPPAFSHSNNQSHPLMAHSGFEHVFCYGDILLSFIWSHEDDIEVKRKMSQDILNTDIEQISTSTTLKHDFIRTQFHRTTHCDFCSKKIWLKDAVQCRECGLCCHKKCIAKCQTSTACIQGEKKTEPETVQPEITMTEPPDEYTEGELKRVNSVKNLAIPGAQFLSTVSKSLPPSPQRTPSRKQSMSNINPFSLCPGVLEDVQKKPEEASESVNRLLEQVMQCPPDETLMDVAKETGKQLYAHMPHEEKVEKVNVMMAELKKTLDSVTLEHMELSKQMSSQESDAEKTKIAFLIGQADAKVQGLSVLMLHYCSSLQHTQEKIV